MGSLIDVASWENEGGAIRAPAPARARPDQPPPPVYFDRARLGAESPAWKRTRSEIVADCRVFKVRRDVSTSPAGDREHDFFVVEAGDWINVVPLTSAGEVVMIEQYRHGSEDVTLEIPGGMVDGGESAAEAAARELIEETGYAAAEIVPLGRVRPNPAIHNNWLHTFLARDARFTRAPEFDTTEHCAVRLVPVADIPRLVASGAITHALVVVGFHWLALWRQGMIKP
ncbi:MAG: NUDIX hydrolase [Acidobacteria bacterium]|nr:NUDIX hydrolase [Acidobacteriota bacterium]